MKSKKKPIRKPKPDMKWQVGEYSRSLEFKSHIPYQFLLLCKIVNVPPERMLIDFMDNLSCGSWKREGRDDVKAKLIEYFLLHQYGQNYYSADQISVIFKEMDAVGILFPKNENMKMIDAYAEWREKHHKYWFKKWFYKNQRSPLKPKT